MGSQQIMIYMMKMTGFKFFDTKNSKIIGF
jgi:hypothetical protein